MSDIFANIQKMEAGGDIDSAGSDWDDIVKEETGDNGSDTTGTPDKPGKESTGSGQTADSETELPDSGEADNDPEGSGDTETPAEAAAPDAVADEWKPPTREEWEATQKAQKTLDELNNQFVRDPVTMNMAYFEAMTPAQKAVYLQTLQMQTPQGQPAQQQPATADLPGYDPELATAAEKLAYDNRDWLTQGPQQVKGYVDNKMAEELAWRDQHMSAARLDAAVSATVLPKLLDLLGVAMPAFDPTKVFAEVAQGKSVEDAVKAQLEKPLADAVALKKAQNKPAPRTVSNGSGRGGRESDKDKTFEQIAKEELLNAGYSGR
jgi:hypothetical protein